MKPLGFFPSLGVESLDGGLRDGQPKESIEHPDNIPLGGLDGITQEISDGFGGHLLSFGS